MEADNLSQKVAALIFSTPSEISVSKPIDYSIGYLDYNLWVLILITAKKL